MSRWIINAVLATVCYLTHLSSYVFLGIAVATIVILDISKKSITTRYLVSSTGLLVPLILFAVFMGGTGSNSGMTFSDVRSKLTSSLVMFTSYNASFDLVLAGILVAILLLSVTTAKRRVIHWPAATLAGVFFLCFLLSPAMLFTSHMADTRFMPVVTIFGFASMGLAHSQHLGRYLIAITLVLFAARSGMIVYEWVNLSPKLAQHYNLATMFPEGSRIKSLYYTETITFQKRERPFEHLLSYLMIDKNVIVSDFIAKRGQQPVVYRRPSTEFTISPNTQLDERYLHRLEQEHDHIWAYKLSEAHSSVLRKHYRLLYSNTEASLYSLR